MLLQIRELVKSLLARKGVFLHQRKKRNKIGHASEDMFAQGCSISTASLFEQLVKCVRFTTL